MKLILLNQNSTEYLLAHLTELDEEPALFLQNTYKIIDCAEYGEDPEKLHKRAALSGDHIITNPIRKIEETNDAEWYCLEYAILERYPKYTDQRDLFLTTEAIFTILDPTEEILKLYNRYLGS